MFLTLPPPNQRDNISSPQLSRALLELRHHRQQTRTPHWETPRDRRVGCSGHWPPAGVAWSRHTAPESLAPLSPLPGLPSDAICAINQALQDLATQSTGNATSPPHTHAVHLHHLQQRGEEAFCSAGSWIWKLWRFSRGSGSTQVSAFRLCSPTATGVLRCAARAEPGAAAAGGAVQPRLRCSRPAALLQSLDRARLLASFVFN